MVMVLLVAADVRLMQVGAAPNSLLLSTTGTTVSASDLAFATGKLLFPLPIAKKVKRLA